MSQQLRSADALKFSERVWEAEIVPALEEYIRIPNRSQAFDPQWREAGHMKRAVDLIAAWCKKQPIKGLTVEVIELENASPLIYMEIPGTGADTVLMYGHCDKQPEFLPWESGLEPWVPTRKGDRLYGRGGADDGYSSFASLSAIRLLQEQGTPHARIVVLIESQEESGSPDLERYVRHLAPRIGQPTLVVCLDSGCGNYDQLWMTTSLRGMIAGNLKVQILTEGVHSGDASGVVASTFRILRMVLSRIEDEQTGKILVDGLHVQIPPARIEQARAAAEVLGRDTFNKFPWVEGARPVAADLGELVLNRTWRPALAITAAEGLPAMGSAGNVLRPFTSVKISMRIPPRLDPAGAVKALKAALEKDPPYGAKVTFDGDKASTGWDAPALAPWLEKSVMAASQTYFGKPAMAMGEGGTIPFMGMLGERFPQAQFLITGVLGPQSNAHGPNEFLHLPTGKKLTAAVAAVIADHFSRGA